MKKTMLAVALAAALTPNFAFAEQGDWVVRLRAVNINPSESSKLGEQTNKAYPDLLGNPGAETLYANNNANLSVDSNTIPELDISYYVTKNIALELILALGTKHDVSISGLGPGAAVTNKNLGEVNLLPPTLTAQWHFRPDQTFDPYVGAGVSYIRAMDNGLTADTIPAPDTEHRIRIDRNMWGPALQAGFDINLKDGWMINFDVKKIWFETDVKLSVNGGDYKKIDELDINPLVVGIGFGKRF